MINEVDPMKMIFFLLSHTKESSIGKNMPLAPSEFGGQDDGRKAFIQPLEKGFVISTSPSYWLSDIESKNGEIISELQLNVKGNKIFDIGTDKLDSDFYSVMRFTRSLLAPHLWPYEAFYYYVVIKMLATFDFEIMGNVEMPSEKDKLLKIKLTPPAMPSAIRVEDQNIDSAKISNMLNKIKGGSLNFLLPPDIITDKHHYSMLRVERETVSSRPFVYMTGRLKPEKRTLGAGLLPDKEARLFYCDEASLFYHDDYLTKRTKGQDEYGSKVFFKRFPIAGQSWRSINQGLLKSAKNTKLLSEVQITPKDVEQLAAEPLVVKDLDEYLQVVAEKAEECSNNFYESLSRLQEVSQEFGNIITILATVVSYQ